MQELQIRKLRAEFNGSLLTRRSISEIKADGDAFEAKYGPSIWGCKCQGEETFSDVYNAHMQREREAEEWKAENDYKAANILSEIEGCGIPGWYNLKAFVERRPELLDRQEVVDALEERRTYLEIPEEE